MPKVSDEYLEQRRTEILSAAGACFAEHGFEGTTVRRLEDATGLSRGAIFHYFDDKEDLFLAVAEARTQELTAALADAGPLDALRLMADQDPATVGTFVEVARKVRTDPAFGARWQARGEAAGRALEERIQVAVGSGTVRGDVDSETLATLVSLLVDGLALYVAMAGGPPEHLDEVIGLLDDAFAPR